MEFCLWNTCLTNPLSLQTMKSLREAIKEKRLRLLTRDVMLLHDNAPVRRKSKKIQTAVLECGFQEMNHSPYSPDLAPSDYFLFSHLKKHLRFSSDTHTHNEADVSSWLQGQDHNFFLDRISSLAAKWNKCIELEEDYVKNNKILVDLTILHDIQVDNFLAPLVSLLMTIYRVRQNKTPQHENRNALIFLHQTLLVCSTHNCPQI